MGISGSEFAALHRQMEQVLEEEAPLLKAARANNIDLVREEISRGADVNVRNRHGETALAIAENPEIVKMLLDAGADPNIPVYGGTSPLFWIHVPKFRAKGRLLLEAGANVNQTNSRGKTPLESIFGWLDNSQFDSIFPTIQLLLQYGATLPDRAKLSRLSPENQEKLIAEAAWQRRTPLLTARYGPGGPMYKRGVMRPKEPKNNNNNGAGSGVGGTRNRWRRNKTVRRRKSRSTRNNRKH